MVRSAQKGEMENPSPEISKIASTVSKSDVKKMASTKHKGLPEVKESLVSVLHRLKEEGVPARIEGPQKGLGAALCPVCGQMGCTKDHDAEEEVKEGVGDTIKKGLKRHKKAVENKKVKERKAVPYAALAAEHEPEGEMVEAKERHPRDQKELDRAQAYIKKNPNFGKKAVKEEVVDEGLVKTAVRAGIKVAGKTGGKVVKTAIKQGGEELKKQAVKTAGEVATNAAKKIGEKSREKANKKIGVSEAKVDAGKSPETKEKERNVRKFGVSHNVSGHGKLRRSLHKMNRGDKKIKGDKSAWTEMESMQYEAKVDKGIPDYKRATKRDERYGNPHGSHALGGGIRKDRRADHEERRGVKKEEVEVVNEISSKTLSNYIKKGTKDIAKRASDDESHSGPKYGKKMSRMDGVMRAADKLAKKANANEEVEMTRKAYKKLHKDFKSDDPKNPRTTKYNPKTGGTESHPVKFVDEERNARKMNVRTKKTIGATIEKNAAAEAKRRANKTGEYKETPKKKRSLKKPSQLTKVTGGDAPKAKKVQPKKTPITKATVTKPEPKKKSAKKPPAMKKAVERKKEVIKQPEKKSFKDFVSQGVKRHKKATQGARVFGKGVVAGAKKAVKFAKDVKKAVSEEVIMESKVKKVAAMIKNLKKQKPLPISTGRDAGAIAAKKMRDKEHNKYVNFLDSPDD